MRLRDLIADVVRSLRKNQLPLFASAMAFRVVLAHAFVDDVGL